MVSPHFTPEKIGLVFEGRLSGFVCDPGSPGSDVLGSSQPSLRDWSRYTSTVDLFSASTVQIGIEKANLDRADVGSVLPRVHLSLVCGLFVQAGRMVGTSGGSGTFQVERILKL
jgi:hypothetical protein